MAVKADGDEHRASLAIRFSLGSNEADASERISARRLARSRDRRLSGISNRWVTGSNNSSSGTVYTAGAASDLVTRLLTCFFFPSAAAPRRPASIC